MRLLLTGNPGVGKTTVVRGIIERLKQVNCAGFYTEEKRQGGQRVGFSIITLDGSQGTLASVGRREPTVGRYSVHVEEFEVLVLPLLDPAITPADLYVIDEIGKMELFSPKFRSRIIDLLAEPAHLLATITKRGKGFVEQIKSRNDVELIEVTRQNRDALPEAIARSIEAAILRKPFEPQSKKRETGGGAL
jgi:nucleoside-triphosphatase